MLRYMFCVVLSDETSGSEEETLHYYSLTSDQALRSRKKKRPKPQIKTSQSLFSVILSVNHGLVALQTNSKVNAHSFYHLLSSGIFQQNMFYDQFEFPSFFSRGRIKLYWITNMVNSGWR